MTAVPFPLHCDRASICRQRRALTPLNRERRRLEVPEALREAIENERGTLSKAESILRCLKMSLEFGAYNAVKGPYYPDVAEIACSLLRQALNGLDSVNLSNSVMKHKSRKAVSRT